jgi:hypothetical protein
MIVIPVFVATVVVVPVPRFVAVPVTLVAISVSISIPSHLPAVVPPPVIGIVIVSPSVVSVVIVSFAVAETRVDILAEAWVLAETRFVLASPFPIFPLPLTVQPVVFDIVVLTFGQPLPVVRIVSVIPAVAAAVIGIV